MVDFFDDFDLEDAAIFGGISGFVEESLREENRTDPSEIREDYDVGIDDDEEIVPSLKRQLQMLAAQNPGFAEHVIRRDREDSEQVALQTQAMRLATAAVRAHERQDEEEKNGTLSKSTMSDALTKWGKYKWALLDEKEHEQYPVLYLLGEAISEGWRVKLDYQKFDGQWEEGLILLPKRFAKLKDKVFLHAFCEKWEKEWYFHMDRVKNINLVPENKEKRSSKMAKIRVYELARELNMESKEVVKRLIDAGFAIKNYMSTLDEDSAESVREVLTSRDFDSTDRHPSDNFMELYEESLKSIQEGEIVKGEIVQVDKEYVFVDIGYKSGGEIPIREFLDSEGNVTANVGDKIEVLLFRSEEEEGIIRLSKEKAAKIKIWDDLKGIYENNGTIKGKIQSRIKGGFSVDIGLQAFLPRSQVDLRPVRDMDSLVGTEHEFKIVKYNKRRGNIVLSRRAVLDKNLPSDYKELGGGKQIDQREENGKKPHISLSLRLTDAAARKILDIGRQIDGDMESIEENLRYEAYRILQLLLGTGKPLHSYLRQGGKGHNKETIIDVVIASDTEDHDTCKVIEMLLGETLVLIGIEKEQGPSIIFLVIDVKVLAPHKGKMNAFSQPAIVKFYDEETSPYLVDFGLPRYIKEKIKLSPTRKDYQKTIEERLENWKLFLDLRKRIAISKQFSLGYMRYRLGQSPRFLTFYNLKEPECSDKIDWDKVKNALGEWIELKIKGEKIDDPNGYRQPLILGDMDSYSEKDRTITIRLNDDMRERLNSIDSMIPSEGILSYTPGGDLSEIKNQSNGLGRFERGEICNPRLGEFLFDATSARIPDDEDKITISKDELLLDHINPLQHQAVEGALSCPDLFLIKGPPGTGKTTVIAEICYQMAKRGKRTLIASQTNLAIDNALSMLEHDPSILALRLGREGGIEEEGKPFIESNIIETWLAKTAKDCNHQWEELNKIIKEFALFIPLKNDLQKYLRDLERKERLEEKFKQNIKKNKGEAEEINEREIILSDKIIDTKANTEEIDRFIWIVDSKEDPEKIEKKSCSAYEIVNFDQKYMDFLKVLGDIQHSLNFLSEEEILNLSNSQAEENWTKDLSLFSAYRLGFKFSQTADIVENKYTNLWPTLKRVKDKIHEYDAVCNDFLNTRNLKDQVKVGMDNEQKRKENINKEIFNLDSEITALKTFVNHLTGKPFPVYSKWVNILYKEVIQRLRDGKHLYSIEEIQGPVISSQIITEELFSRIWEKVISKIKNDFIKSFEVCKLAVNDERIRKDLPKLKKFCEEILEKLKDELKSLGAFSDISTFLVDEKEFQMILRQVPSGVRWNLDPHFLSNTKKKRDSYRKGDNLTKITDALINRLVPEKVKKRKIERFKRGIIYFKGLRKVIDKALSEMSQAIKEDNQNLKESMQSILELIRGTVLSETDNLKTQIEDKHVLRKEKVNEVGKRFEAAKNEFHELGQMLNQQEETLGDMISRIKEENESMGHLGNYPPLLKMAELLPKILTIYSTDKPVEEWNLLYEKIQENLEALRIKKNPFTDLQAALKNTKNSLDSLRKEMIKDQQVQKSRILELVQEIEELEKIYQKHIYRLNSMKSWWEETYTQVCSRAKGFSDYWGESTDIHSVVFLRNLIDKIGKLDQEMSNRRSYIERYQKLAGDWIDRIKKKNKKDREDLRKTYITNANVIGTTCSMPGKIQFQKDYETFDVVIVDEVSKATPPELLLPLLLGKKAILIGDDKQLPPMIGPDTLRDLAREVNCSEDDLSYLKRSIFAELWETAAPDIKTMLKVQYRMHPAIMNVINQFYDDRLECGIEDPDSERAHGCAGLRIPENKHAVWIDVPLSNRFREEKLPGGTSYKNEAELDAIKSVVRDLNDAWETEIRKGSPPKQVGIITFYSLQARRLKDIFLDNQDTYPNLVFRIGTVDRFQGMERPIVIVSMVCNNQIGRIGFAEEPERINVAFSRAQELLVIVGCARLFCSESRSYSARKIYQNVADFIRYEGDLTDVSRFLNN